MCICGYSIQLQNQRPWRLTHVFENTHTRRNNLQISPTRDLLAWKLLKHTDLELAEDFHGCSYVRRKCSVFSWLCVSGVAVCFGLVRLATRRAAELPVGMGLLWGCYGNPPAMGVHKFWTKPYQSIPE